VQDYQYRYDPVGNILEKATEHGTYAYEYDPRDRLTRAANPALPDEAWTYDPAGNRTSDASLPGPWTYDDANALQNYANVTLRHDANGSTTQKTVAGQTTSYLYDLENRLTEVKDPTGATLATYGYDPFGRRLWKDTGGTRTYFVYSEEGLVAELDATGNLIQSYGYIPQSPYGTVPLYTRTTTGYAYYQLDHLGTPQVLTDKSGKILWQGRARAFGETTEIVNLVANPLRFPGQYEDNETGLHYNYFRYYDPEIGRYISSDPIGLEGGVNTFLYTFANPNAFLDPKDLKIWVCYRKVRIKALEDYNHTYFWNDKKKSCCGRAPFADPFKDCFEKGPKNIYNPDGDECYPVAGSEGIEEKIINCCKKRGKKGIYVPFSNDCFNTVDDCLKKFDLSRPPVKRGSK